MNENKKITVTLLAKKMNVSKATMSRMINTFYEQGLTLDKGKCQLSKKGQEYIEKIQEKIKNLTYWLQETSHLNEEEARQEAIMKKEKEASDLKRKYFGPEGELFKKRESLMSPIQEEIYTAVKEISELRGYSLVLDRASDAGIIFGSPKIDISNEVLQKLGYN